MPCSGMPVAWPQTLARRPDGELASSATDDEASDPLQRHLLDLDRRDLRVPRAPPQPSLQGFRPVLLALPDDFDTPVTQPSSSRRSASSRVA